MTGSGVLECWSDGVVGAGRPGDGQHSNTPTLQHSGTPALFPVRDVDRRAYAERIRDFLPDEIIDVHTHVWLERNRSRAGEESGRTVTWPARVARDNPIEDLVETYHLLLPGKRVTPLIFANAGAGDDLNAANEYVRQSAAAHGFPALLFASPRWSAAELDDRLTAGGFLGVKVYLTLAEPYIPANEIRIFDYLPPHQLEVLNRRGLPAMLHVPRPARLRDPVNLAQLLAIERDYPDVKLIVAHVGRAYCPEDIGHAFEVLAGTQRMLFDISANTCATVFEGLIRAVGPRRILFGSDLPILRMRMRRVCEEGVYVNVVPRGLYGDVSGDPHMRECDGDEAAGLTFFLYEEIAAFRRAAEATGLSRADVADVFHGNAARLLAGLKG